MPKPSWAIQAVSFLTLAAAFGCAVSAAEPTSAGMYEITLSGQKVEGLPITWNSQIIRLLGRDGRIWEFEPKQVTGFKKSSAQFHPDSISAIRAMLMREYGNGYEVSGTTHYLVVHPSGQRDKWADRFEDLYRSFVHFFSVRGFNPGEPMFPLIGIVCRDQMEFHRHAQEPSDKNMGSVPMILPAKMGLSPLSQAFFQSNVYNTVVGYYDRKSNRISLFDMGGGEGSDNWRENAETLIHEATHQTAFNTGVLNRYGHPPLWVVEGMAMLFEAPGVYDSRSNVRLADRVNSNRLQLFQKMAPQHQPEKLAWIVASDDSFCSSPLPAYAEAWAFTFFLTETEPDKYFKFLKRTASRPPFQEYTAAERTADFKAVFGSDWRMLEARFLRFMEGIK